MRLVFATALAAIALMAAAPSAWALQAVAPDGSVFVAWGAVEVTRIAPDGVPTGVIEDIAPEPIFPPGPDQTEDSGVTGLAVAPDGVVTVVWLDIVNWDARIMTRRLAPDGTPLGEPVELAADQEIHIRPQLALAPDGTATVVWGRPSPGGGEIVMRRVAPDGTPEDETQVVSPEGNPYRQEMATAPDGTATVVWNQKEGEGTVLMERRIAPDGTLEPEAHQLGESDWAMGEPQVAVAGDGTAKVLWERWGQTEDEELWTRQVEADGTPQPQAHLLDAGERTWFTDLQVAPDGTALVGWDRASGPRQATFIAADGTPASAGSITYAGSPLDEWPRVVPTPESDFMLSWRGHCGAKQCLLAGRIDQDLDVAGAAVLDEGGQVGGGAGVFLPDGTGSYLWGKTVIANSEGFLRTRRIEPDGTLGPVYDLYQPEPEPFVWLYPTEADLGAVAVGATASESIGVFVRSVEPLGTFSPSISGPDADRFQVEGSTCSAADVHPTNCTITVSFSPDTAGPAAAELVVEAGDGLPASVSLAGEGTVPASPVQPDPAQVPVPPVIQLGKPRLDSSAGSATLGIDLPGPGSVRMYGPCVGGPDRERSFRADSAGTVELTVLARGHCRRQLFRKGTTRFGVRVAFTGVDGQVVVGHRPVRLRLEA